MFLATNATRYGQPRADTPNNTHEPNGTENTIDLSYAGPADPATVTQYGDDDVVEPNDLKASTTARVPLLGQKGVYLVLTKGPGAGMWLEGASSLGSETIVVPALTYVCGFGTGTWTKDANDIQFKLTTDVEYVTLLGEDRSKKTTMLCKCLQNIGQSGKLGKLQYHELSPLIRTDTNQLVPNRFKVAPTHVTSFKPNAINVDDRVATGTAMTQHEMGATFMDCGLPLQDCMVCFMCEPCVGSDTNKCCIKPRSPTLCLRHGMTVYRSKAVRLRRES